MENMVIWITGLPGSGKSTIAEAFLKRHPECQVLRMDELRKVVTPEPTYSEEEREIVYRAIVYLAKRLSEAGHPVVIDATGNLRRWRALAREAIGNFIEVYVRCPVQICREREERRRRRHSAPDRIYEKGEKGWPVPGVTVPYEEPFHPEVVIDSDRMTVDESVMRIEEYLRSP